MRDRWLSEEFATKLSLSTNEYKQINHNDYRVLCEKNSINEEEAVRLLCNYGIAEEKAKIKLQVE